MVILWHFNAWHFAKTCCVTQNVVHLILHSPCVNILVAKKLFKFSHSSHKTINKWSSMLVHILNIYKKVINDNATKAYISTHFKYSLKSYKWPCHLSWMAIGWKVGVYHILMWLLFQFGAIHKSFALKFLSDLSKVIGGIVITCHLQLFFWG